MSKAQQTRLKRRLLLCGLALVVSVAAAILLVVSANAKRAQLQAESEAAASVAQAAAESEAAAKAASEAAAREAAASWPDSWARSSSSSTDLAWRKEVAISRSALARASGWGRTSSVTATALATATSRV